MTGTKRMLLGGAAVSLALATMAAPGLPARAQQATDVAGCAELEGEALAACLEAEVEAVEDEPEEGVLNDAEGAPEAEAEPEAAEVIELEPNYEAGEEPAPADAVEPGVSEDEPDSPEAEPELREETEADAVDVPEAAEVEAETVEETDTTDEVEATEESDAVEEVEPELLEEADADAADVPEGADEAEVEAEAVEETDTTNEVDATEELDAVEEAEPELLEETDAGTANVPEADEEAESVEEVDATDEVEAAAVDPEDVLSEEELEAAQRASIEEAVQAALAAERQKPQAQQETERDDRMRILGAAGAGLAAGAILPQIGAMLVGQQGDRVILQQDERLIVRRDETARFLQEGSDATVEDFADGVTLVTVTRPDGSRVLSWRDASGQVVRRVRVLPDGREITLFDGLEAAAEPEIVMTELPPIRREDQQRAFLSVASAEDLLRVLSAQPVSAVEDRFTLRQVLANDRIRWLMPSLALDAVTFDTGSATLGVDEIQALDTMGRKLREMVEEDPREVFLVEGHTDAVGSDIANLALSDRRAETVATLLSAYYEVPPENLVVQGFGEQDLRVPTLAASRENRRVEVRRITPLLR